MRDRHFVVPASYLLLRKNGNEFLMLKRANTGYMDGYYSLVAGHVDPNESFTKTIIREAKEEAGITLQEEHLNVVHIMHRKSDDHERIDTFFLADVWEGELQNCEPHKCSDLSWFKAHELPDKTLDYVKDVILAVADNKFYSEFGWD